MGNIYRKPIPEEYAGELPTKPRLSESIRWETEVGPLLYSTWRFMAETHDPELANLLKDATEGMDRLTKVALSREFVSDVGEYQSGCVDHQHYERLREYRFGMSGCRVFMRLMKTVTDLRSDILTAFERADFRRPSCEFPRVDEELYTVTEVTAAVIPSIRDPVLREFASMVNETIEWEESDAEKTSDACDGIAAMFSDPDFLMGIRDASATEVRDTIRDKEDRLYFVNMSEEVRDGIAEMIARVDWGNSDLPNLKEWLATKPFTFQGEPTGFIEKMQ